MANRGQWKYIFLTGLMLVAVMVSALALPGCGSQPASPKPEAGLKTVLRVGTTAAHPPFSFRDPKTGEVTGFDLDLVRAIGQAENMEVKVQVLDPVALEAALKAGSIDAAIGALSPTQELAKEADFCDAYLTVSLALCASRSAGIKAGADLAGKEVGVVEPAVGWVKSKPQALPAQVELRPYVGWEEAWQDLLSGKIQVLLADRPSLVYMLDRHPQAGLVLGSLEPTKAGSTAGSTANSAQESWQVPLAIAVGKDNEFLRAKINHGLRQVKLTGWFDFFYTRHFVPR